MKSGISEGSDQDTAAQEARRLALSVYFGGTNLGSLPLYTSPNLTDEDKTSTKRASEGSLPEQEEPEGGEAPEGEYESDDEVVRPDSKPVSTVASVAAEGAEEEEGTYSDDNFAECELYIVDDHVGTAAMC